MDPSLRGTGLAILECDGRNYKLLHSETLKLGTKVSSISCLGKIHELVAHLIDLWQPRHLSCEETIYVQNFKTAQIMGASRGAALSAAAIRIFQFLNTHLYGSSRQLWVLVGRAKSKCRSHLPKCLGFPKRCHLTRQMHWGLLFVMP